MPREMAPTYNESMLEIVGKWKASGGVWPAPSEEIAAFALNRNLWEAPRKSLLKQCQRDLSRAMREAYYADPQGRNVRSLHAARYAGKDENDKKVQQVFWADIRTASRDHMERAFQLRRKQIVGDCWQLKTDGDSFNENRPECAPIQMVFDFRDDLAEMEQPDEYRPEDFGEDG